MSMNEIKKYIYATTNWTAPAGVTSVTVNPIYASSGFTDAGTIRQSTGQLYMFGSNAYGQLGVGDTVSRSSPVAVLGGLSFTKFYSVYGSNCFGLTSSGALYGWGNNQSSLGVLGVGDIVPRSSPVAVLGGLQFIDFTTDAAQAVGLTTKSQLYAWGTNTNGNLGVGDTVARSSPVAVLGGLSFSNFVINEGSAASTCYAITYDGTGYSWGLNSSGCLGVGDTIKRSSPVAILGGLSFSKIVPVSFSALGLTRTGQLYAWGQNTDGNLGVGDVVHRSSPVLVLGGITFANIVKNWGASSFALTPDGRLYAWGVNTSGVLGVGDIIPRSSPVAVLGGLKFQKVMASSINFAVGLTFSGDLYAWGANNFGQLGVGDTINRSSPVLVAGGLKFSDFHLRVDQYTVMAVSNGKLYGWGLNNNGQIGVGDVVNRSSPVLVLGTVAPSTMYTSTINTSGQPYRFSVTPGQTYTLLVSQGVSSFNNNAIATGPLEKVELSYFL